MVEMSCEEHDRHAASTQFITHTVGRVLGHMHPGPTPIDTRGYQSLLNLVDNTTHDSFELYYGLFMYNPVSPLPGRQDKLLSSVEGIWPHIEVDPCLPIRLSSAALQQHALRAQS